MIDLHQLLIWGLWLIPVVILAMLACDIVSVKGVIYGGLYRLFESVMTISACLLAVDLVGWCVYGLILLFK